LIKGATADGPKLAPPFAGPRRGKALPQKGEDVLQPTKHVFELQYKPSGFSFNIIGKSREFAISFAHP